MEHSWRGKDELISAVLLWTPKYGHTCSVQTLDVICRTCRERWIIETNGKRELGKSVLSAELNDDDNIYTFKDFTCCLMIMQIDNDKSICILKQSSYSSLKQSHLFLQCFHWSKYLQNFFFDLVWSCTRIFLFISLRIRWISSWGYKKVEDRSSEYEGCCNYRILWFTKNISFKTY